MGKTVSSYRRKLAEALGPEARIRSWRDGNGDVAYRVKCLTCERIPDASGRFWRWESRHPSNIIRRMKGQGHPVSYDDFASVSRRWQVHRLADHQEALPVGASPPNADEATENRLLSYVIDRP